MKYYQPINHRGYSKINNILDPTTKIVKPYIDMKYVKKAYDQITKHSEYLRYTTEKQFTFYHSFMSNVGRCLNNGWNISEKQLNVLNSMLNEMSTNRELELSLTKSFK
jgi:hypothetical protein